eukprot:223586_1
MSSFNSSNSFNASRSNRNTLKPEKKKVRAVTRIRPFFATDITSIHSTELDSCVAPISDCEIGFRQQKYNEILQQTFKFDAVYKSNSTQEQIFKNEVSPLMEHLLNGKKCTIFCYGPTGSGKTFTAFGCNDNVGIMARTVQHVLDTKFDIIQENMHKNNKYECKILLSSLEIYNEKVYDLLSMNNINKQGLPIRQHNNEIIVQGLTKTEIGSIEQFYDIYKRSMKRRKTAFTALNAHSSRSHAIFSIYMEQKMNTNVNKTRFIRGKISIADLAGSENNKRTENTGDRLTESKNINKSLLALGAVIDALNHNSKPPYRDSALTRLLSDSLGGNSVSTMICCVSGSLNECLMTRRCLEFGSNTRKIENKIIAHVENKDIFINSNNASGISRKRKRNDKIYNNTNKRIKLLKQHKYNNNIQIKCKQSPNINNKKKKKIRYSIQPTPTKFIPNDESNLLKHEQNARNKMLNKIDELTKDVKHLGNLLERKSESKEEESEITVYKNDKFGLPPVLTPAVANKNLAISRIKEARKLEKKGKIKEAIIMYKKAKKLCPNHKGLQRKIQQLELSLDSDVIKQLHFEESDEDNDIEKVKKPKKRRKRTLRTKNIVEISSENNNESDETDNNISYINEDEFSYTVDTKRILEILNDSTEVELKGLATIGAAKIKVIVANRPFNTIANLRKVKGFNTFKCWKKFIENNKIVFKKLDGRK